MRAANVPRQPSKLIAEAISWRHHLHAHPEIAYHEVATADFVALQLHKVGLAVHRGLAGTGVVGTLRRGKSRRVIGIRADMDALPIQEQSDTPYASLTPGIMHACGHDGHVAIVLAAAATCANMADLDGTVHFIFQPAEEGGGGGRRMVDEGLFRLFPCDAVFALHNWPALPLGTCVARDGPMMAANAVFEIEVQGRGCHGAMPHEGTDSILAGSQIVAALHTITSRSVNPLEAAVVSPTQVRAGGGAHNIIPDHCFMRGGARWFESKVGDLLEKRIISIADGIAAAYDCEARVSFERRYPATINDPRVAEMVRGVLAESAPDLILCDSPPSTASEDFAFMLQEVPGCYFWLGTARQDRPYGLHSPYFDFNDEVISRAVALWGAIVRKALTSL